MTGVGTGAAGQVLLQALGLPAALLDMHGVVSACNHQFARYLGFDAAPDAVGHRLRKWIDPSRMAELERALEESTPTVVEDALLSVDEHGLGPQLVLLPSAIGLLAVLSAPWTPVPSSRPDFAEFVAGVAHEINNPLGFALPSLAEAERLLLASGADPALLDLMEQAHIGLGRIRQVVADLRSFRPQGSVPSSVDVNAIVVETVRLVRDQARPVRLAWDLGDIPVAAGESGHLGQVLLNLINNASSIIKQSASSRASRIGLRTWSTLGRVYIEVADNGPGIDPDIVERVFDPFVSRRAGGTGLGLAVCFNLMRAMGGHIAVRSRLGLGSTFTLWLPVAQDRVPDPPSPTSGPAVGSRIPRAVIIDDEALLRRTIHRALPADEVVELEGGDAAIAWFSEGHSADVIVCDRVMPLGTGEAVYAWLVANRPSLAERFIFISGASRESIATGGPVPPELEKPFSIQELRELVRRVAGDPPA